MLLIGRNYRKFLSQAVAYAAFRWLAIWLIIAACASYDKPGIAAGLVVAAVDLVLGGNHKATASAIIEQSRNDWKDRLTNRIFYKLLFEEIRGGKSAHIDVDDLFRLASEEAVADIKRASDQSAVEAGFLDRTAWHWVGGIISFLWLVASSWLYYGSALYVGSGGKF